MLGLISLAILGLIIYYVIQTYRSYQRNLAAVKASGLPYITMPIYTFNPLWLLIHTLFMPFVKYIPEEKRPEWIESVSFLPSQAHTNEQQLPHT